MTVSTARTVRMGRAREWCGCPYSFLDDVRRTLREAPGDPRRRPSRGTLTEADVNAAMREIRLALLEADVNFKVVKEFTSTVKERALGSDVLSQLNPGQQVVKIVNEELTALMGGPRPG